MNRHISPEVKAALQEDGFFLIDNGESVANAARRIGVSKSCLEKWLATRQKEAA